jgi:hypothetical protein
MNAMDERRAGRREYAMADLNERSLESIAAEGRRRLGRVAEKQPSKIALMRRRLALESEA